MLTPAPTFASLWTDYRCSSVVYDEARAPDGQLRQHWRSLVEDLRELAPADFSQRTAEAEKLLRDNGVTFDVFREGHEQQRPWQLDLIPLILESSDWRALREGVDQRARLLNAVIQDLHGPRRLLANGWLPAEVLFEHAGFQRPFVDLHATRAPSLTLYGAELARLPDGVWRVIADRTEAPIGAGFALENRIVASRTIPRLMHRGAVQRLAPFFMRLQQTLAEMAARRSDNPRIVLLSTGPTSPYYFEDVFLSGYLGYGLVQGTDLAVRDERVFLKTLAGLMPVDVILSRSPELGLDPLELGGGATNGTPGLLQAVRRGNVALANMPGCGLVESPVFMAFLPDLCRNLLGEELRLPSIETWWCGNPAACQHVLGNLRDLVIKPAFEPSGGEEIFGDRLSDRERDQLVARIQARPTAFVAQPLVPRSGAPAFGDETQLQCGHVAVRMFAVDDHGRYDVMPGGLIRVAPSPDPMELRVAAGFSSKDMWVPAEGPVEPVTLLQARDAPAPLRRSSAIFPSRVADDLFWLGWSLERSDFLARLLRALVERLTAESETDDAELRALIRGLAEQGQLEAGFAVEGWAAQLPRLADVLPNLVVQTEEIRGIGSAVSEMLRLNGLVRDRLSPDAWSKIQSSGSRFLSSFGRTRSDLTETLDRVNDLIFNLASVSGLIQDGMIRGPAWRFLDMGRQIERGRNTATLLHTLVSSGDIRAIPVMRLLLEILDCRMTYRTRYMDNLQPNAVLDLFITDETNPRSVAFQAVSLVQHVEQLPADALSPLQTDEKRFALATLNAVRMVTPEQLASTELTEIEALLHNSDVQFRELTDALTLKYLVHSGSPRQLTDEGEPFA